MQEQDIARLESRIRTAGITPSPDDDRDIVFVPRVAPTAPRIVADFFPRIEDQGNEGDCTAQTATTIAEAIMNHGGLPIPGNGQLAQQFNYFYSRHVFDGSSGDVGASPRSMCRSAKHYGICTDDLWPQTRPVDDEPTAAAVSDAEKRKLGQYELIVANREDPQDLARQVDAAIAEGLIVALAFYCRRWMFYVNGPLGSVGHMGPPMPAGNVGMHEIVGGHIVPLRGYDRSLHPDSGGAYIAQNSWGTSWGDGGLWSINRQQLIEPGFAMEVRVFRGFAGVELAPAAPVPLTIAQINASRAKLAAMGLGAVDAVSGSFSFGPAPEVAYYAAIRALGGMDSAQMAQVAGIMPSVIDGFVGAHAATVEAWKGI